MHRNRLLATILSVTAAGEADATDQWRSATGSVRCRQPSCTFTAANPVSWVARGHARSSRPGEVIPLRRGQATMCSHRRLSSVLVRVPDVLISARPASVVHVVDGPPALIQSHSCPKTPRALLVAHGSIVIRPRHCWHRQARRRCGNWRPRGWRRRWRRHRIARTTIDRIAGPWPRQLVQVRRGEAIIAAGASPDCCLEEALFRGQVVASMPAYAA